MGTIVEEPVDFTYAGLLGDKLFDVVADWRENDPIRWDERAGCWIVTRHADILAALRMEYPVSNRRLESASLSSVEGNLAEMLPNLAHYSPYHPTNIDPPQHGRLRSLLVKAFGRKVVESVRGFARARIETLLDEIEARGTVEFNEDIARALPGTVILKLLNLPDDVYPRLRDWATAVMVGLGNPDPKPEWVIGADRAFAEMTEVFKVAIAERRANPLDEGDFLTALITAREGDDKLTDDQLVAVMQTVLVAGHDTTSNSMTLGVAALSKHPEAWDHMYRNPDQMLPSVIELMRYIAMSAAQNRVAAQDFEWHGRQIRKGDVIYLMLVAGNRDPRVFDNPEVLDLTRANNDQSLTFAPGLHHCIGHLLAKMQMTEFFSALTRRFEGAEVVDETIEYLPILVFRGVSSLNVRFHKRAA